MGNVRKSVQDKLIISVFFNARGDELEKSTIGMYRSLLLQLLERLPVLQCVFGSLGLTTWNCRDQQWAIESLKGLFELAVRNLEESFVACYIDALEECDEHQIRGMMLFFEQVGEIAVSGKFKFHACV
ncbi:hypothetical protein BFJ68_g17650 [Fusarium oxysporum]|uniref:Nephrocystin 3-like N-terminal domain-containing protein n=1 Tax=Fusarium oxysporum TaxID=5507 RepID=A0A420NLM1_FUSOX|nr:hypothetical protein DER44DRAFT_833953 [Fusarium oxysporum]RKK81184.1 hypothetical protein BFJ68_g17650 [Fusarium oxysporum]